NPQYDADPMSLSVGDSLNVEKQQPLNIEKEPVYAIPPESPKRFNQPLNTFYNYTERCLVDTSIASINRPEWIEKDIPVVNLKIVSTELKATDYGKLAFLALPASTTSSNLGIISTNTTSTLGQWSITGEALSSFARVGGVLVAALWPSQLGDGTLEGNPEFATSDTVTMRVRFNMYTDENGKQQIVGIKTGEGSAYGDRVAKREAVQQGQHFIAELDNGISITWTPDGSTDVLTPDTVLPENDQLDVHNIWVRPIEEHEQEIGTVLYPEEDLAEYIVTFPADAGVSPLYLVFNKPTSGSATNLKYVPAPRGNPPLPAFPEAVKAKKKTTVQGGGKLRERWKDRKGRIYEWDSQHGNVEVYTKNGKHLGEFNHITGEQTKDADPSRKVEK
ncbi:colicin E3/pyocin S6 family cytotoxin, partial [Vibrio sp. TRT 29B02]|uniref:colicin E3/pyocin S6 family cytotoxin n=1 Tax=Vibrio sp. TRT 29B02 TaxID=3418508 RepID=UPI003CF59037